MPKISALTVKEHHDNIFEALLNAAEDILRHEGVEALTAGAVAKQAGIARNSIYRYVKSVDDLRLHVLDRYLPVWTHAVTSHLKDCNTPEDQLLGVARESLVMAQTTGHSWLISVMRSVQRSQIHHSHKEDDPRPMQHGVAVTPAIKEFHQALAGRVEKLWKQIDPALAAVKARFTLPLIENGMTMLDSGLNFDDVADSLEQALQGMMKRN